jgi:hypothetical protein
MFKEYDKVKSLRDLSDTILKGCQGIVVYVYSGSAPVCEVEFFDDKLDTIGVLTVNLTDIIKVV